MAEETDLKIAFGDLDRGEMYPIYEAQRVTSTLRDGKKIDGIRAKIDNCGVSMFTWLPKSFLKKSDTFYEEVCNAGKTDKPYNLCFYGTLDRQNVAKIHNPGEGKFLCSNYVNISFL